MLSQTVTPLRVVAVLAALVVVGAVAVGVGSQLGQPQAGLGAIPAPRPSSPSPSASASVSEPVPSPEPTTPEELKAKNIAEAKARLVEYYATTAEVANGGYVDWEEKLLPFWGHPDIRQSLRRAFSQYAEDGRYTVGAAVVDSMSVATYAPAEQGFEEVGIRACVNFATVENFAKGGTPIPRDAGTPTRYSFDYLMAHQGTGSVWTINEQVPRVEEPC